MKLADYHISIGNATDTGKVRNQNEDYLAHFDCPLGYCIVICDGMGGHTAGQIASQSAIIAIQHYLQDPQNSIPDIPGALDNAFEFANFQLKEMAREKPDLHGMGTTCVLALISNGRLFTAHAGDSRIYLARNKHLRQITKDHSSVQQLMDEGVLTKEEAEISVNKNQIVKAIGVFEKVTASVSEQPIELHRGDKLLLCSDGLTENLSEEGISAVILLNNDVQNTSLELVKLANDNGGTDNITVQVVYYNGNGETKGSDTK